MAKNTSPTGLSLGRKGESKMKRHIYINNVDELLLAQDLNAVYELTEDIDLGGRRWEPLGTREQPFTGSFCGNYHTISNFELAPNFTETGFFGVLDGVVKKLNLSNITIQQNSTQDTCAGLIAGINYGKIEGVAVDNSHITISAEAGELSVGLAVGENCGEIRNVEASANVRLVGNGGTITAGQFVGVSTGGILETIVSTGEFAVTGAQELLNVALYAGKLKNTCVMGCCAGSEFNTINGKCFINRTCADEDVLWRQNRWRDNRGDDRFLSPDEYQVRAKAASTMRTMATIEWTPDRTLDYYCSCAGKVHRQVFPAGVTQHGIPYTHTFKSLESFQDCFTEDGKLKPYIKSDGYDGFDLYLGCDCSGAVYWAWNSVSDQVKFRWTSDEMRCDHNGVKPLGGYEAGNPDSREIIKRYSSQEFAEFLAQMHMGDGLVAVSKGINHTRLASHSSVVYRYDDDSIDTIYSHTVTIEQGDGLLYEPQKQASRSWLVDYEYSFNRLMRDGYMPITIDVFKEGKIPKAQVTYSCSSEKDVVVNGTVESNFRIVSTTATVYAENGEQIWQKKLFTGVHPWAERGNDYIAREHIRKVDMQDYKPYWKPSCLQAGASYKYTLTVSLANGEKLQAVSVVFTA